MKKKNIKIRKTWGSLKPTERIHGEGKKHGYDRQRENSDWKKEVVE